MAKETGTVAPATKKSDTSILSHNCDNPGQDALHGKGQRVMNYAPGKSAWRCTVCKVTR